DPDLTVRFQLALALGASKDAHAGDALARLAERAGSEPWLRAAILSAAVPHAPRILRAAVARDEPDRALVSGLVATIVGTKDRQAIDAAAQAVMGSGRPGAPW